MIARVLVCVGLAGCYQPRASVGAPCDERGACPSGQVCIANRCQTDADRPDAHLVDAAQGDAADARWSVPVPLASLNTSGSETDPTFTWDRLTVVYASDDELFLGTRSSPAGAFTVQPLTTLNTGAKERSPEISPAGDTLYFTSDRLAEGRSDVYVVRRIAGAFETAPTLVPELSTPEDERDVAISPDGLTAILARDSQLLRATRSSENDPWSMPAALGGELGVNPAAPSLTTVGDLYFHAGTERDLFVARRVGAGFLPPSPVVELNVAGQRDASPFVSPDERHMMFERNGDLYETAR